MNKSIFIMLLSLIPVSNLWASGQIDYLNIDNHTVHFSTNGGKSAESPACVSEQTADNWTISLTSESGSAIYSLLITATAGKLPIDVVSANDCADADGTERAASVAISPVTDSSSADTQKPLNLYKGDGETLLGRIVSAASDVEYYYLSPTNANSLHFYNISLARASVLFSEENCTGTASFHNKSRSQIVFNPLLNNGKYVQVSSNKEETVYGSQSNYLGECYNSPTLTEGDRYVVESESVTHPLCGDAPCVIKQE